MECWKCGVERCEECDRQYLLKKASEAIKRAKARLDRMDEMLESFKKRIQHYKGDLDGKWRD